MSEETIDILKNKKRIAMVKKFDAQLSDPAFNEPGVEESLGFLAGSEVNRRQNNKLAQLIREAQFSVPCYCIEEIG